MASWSGGGDGKTVGVVDMLNKYVIIYPISFFNDVPTRDFNDKSVVELKPQLHADVVIIDRSTGQVSIHRDQTIRSWKIIKIARGNIGGNPVLGTMQSPNGQAPSAIWVPLDRDQSAVAAADNWLNSLGPEGFIKSAPRAAEEQAPIRQQSQQQGYQGWPQGSMPAQQYYQQQQAPPQWANQQPQYGQPQQMPPQQMPPQQPAPQWANQPQQAPQGQQGQQPVQQAPQWGNQPQGYGGQQGQPQQQNPQWGQSQQPAQPPQWMQQQAPQQQVGQQSPPQTSLQAMMAAGAVAPPPQAPMGYDGAPADQGPPPF